MWTSQVYGHHDKMARTKTHRTLQNTEYTKTQQACIFCLIMVKSKICTNLINYIGITSLSYFVSLV